MGVSTRTGKIMTPTELIDMLSRWEPDEPFETRVQNNPLGEPDLIVVLIQGTNIINLTGKD